MADTQEKYTEIKMQCVSVRKVRYFVLRNKQPYFSYKVYYYLFQITWPKLANQKTDFPLAKYDV